LLFFSGSIKIDAGDEVHPGFGQNADQLMTSATCLWKHQFFIA
jgi:hypothetical protein